MPPHTWDFRLASFASIELHSESPNGQSVVEVKLCKLFYFQLANFMAVQNRHSAYIQTDVYIAHMSAKCHKMLANGNFKPLGRHSTGISPLNPLPPPKLPCHFSDHLPTALPVDTHTLGLKTLERTKSTWWFHEAFIRPAASSTLYSQSLNSTVKFLGGNFFPSLLYSSSSLFSSLSLSLSFSKATLSKLGSLHWNH